MAHAFSDNKSKVPVKFGVAHARYTGSDVDIPSKGVATVTLDLPSDLEAGHEIVGAMIYKCQGARADEPTLVNLIGSFAGGPLSVIIFNPYDVAVTVGSGNVEVTEITVYGELFINS